MAKAKPLTKRKTKKKSLSLPAAAAVVVAADKQLPVKRKTVSKHPILQQKRSSIQNRQSTEDDIPVPLSSNPMDLLEAKFGSMIVIMNPTLKDNFTKTSLTKSAKKPLNNSSKQR